MNIYENRLEATVATIDVEMDKELQELSLIHISEPTRPY